MPPKAKKTRKRKLKPISSHLFSETACRAKNSKFNYSPCTAEEFPEKYYDVIQSRAEKLIGKCGSKEMVVERIQVKKLLQELDDIEFEVQTIQAENNQLRDIANACSKIVQSEYQKESLEHEIEDLDQPLPPKKLRNQRMLPPPQSLKIPTSSLPQFQPPIGISTPSVQDRQIYQMEKHINELQDLISRLESEISSTDQRIRILRKK